MTKFDFAVEKLTGFENHRPTWHDWIAQRIRGRALIIGVSLVDAVPV